MSGADRITVGLTKETHELLQKLQAEGIFDEMRDGYRLGIALAIARGGIAAEDQAMRTFVNVGTLDPDGAIRDMITELYPEAAGKPYAIAERLAEYGVSQLGPLYESGQLQFGQLLNTVSHSRASEEL